MRLRFSAPFSVRSWQLLFLLGLSFAIASGSLQSDRATAATPDTAPAELKQAISQLDAAANRRNAQEVLQFYSPNFTHSDGLNRQGLEQSLTQLWKQYPTLTYKTELQSWQPSSNGFQAETVTRITGTQTQNGQQVKLDATLRSRQQFQNQKIVRQDILSEKNLITTGDKPPSVNVSLPDQVRTGQEFSFDAIVQEPLENDLLLGAVVQEPVNSNGYLKPATADLDLLTSGGLFKVGKAPSTAGSQWVSAVLVRHGGMTMVTQRMNVVAAGSTRPVR
ncbi:MAG: nuclear transport factor 2 family protein [Phormidium tanganyikae FI6-MK23]|jgi:ketosteroid isomerase-like protein|nr:nuclear transport factor 2 family protein [Phormidium tanganyikae FI6-MK23]